MSRVKEIVTLAIEHDEGQPVTAWDWQRFVSDDATRITVLGVVSDQGAVPMENYRAVIHQNYDGVDIGDWLPQDREHYERVGPFQLAYCKTCDERVEVTAWDTSVSPNVPTGATHNNGNQSHAPDIEYRSVGWSTWWDRDDAKVDNWQSFGMVLQHRCATDDEWHDTAQSLWGLDFTITDPKAPVDGRAYTLDELPDDYLRETLRDLAYEHHHRDVK